MLILAIRKSGFVIAKSLPEVKSALGRADTIMVVGENDLLAKSQMLGEQFQKAERTTSLLSLFKQLITTLRAALPLRVFASGKPARPPSPTVFETYKITLYGSDRIVMQRVKRVMSDGVISPRDAICD